MKVLFISHYTSLYGANRSLLNMVKLLQENHGVEPFVLMPGSGDLEGELKSRDIPYLKENWYNWGRSEGRFQYHPKELAKKLLNLFLFRKILGKVKAKNQGFDLIHTNSSVTQIGGFLSKQLNIPHIWHLREFGEEDYGIIHDGGMEKAGQNFEKHADLLIANSKAVKRKYSRFVDENLIQVVYNGVSLKENYIERDFSNLSRDSALNFLLVGVVNKAKGQLEALKASSILKNEYGFENFELNFVGGGNNNYLNKLKEFVKEEDLGEIVNFIGYKSNVSEVRKKNDVSLVCSRQEAFGRVTVEAMLSQMPVIGTNSGGTQEIIDHKETGFLYEKGSPEELADYMKVFMDNRSLIKQFGQKGYRTAKENFTARKNAENIYEKYKTILPEKGGEFWKKPS